MNPFAYNFGGTIYDKVEDPEKDIFLSIMTQRKAKYTKGHDGVFNPQNLDEKKIMWHTFFHQDWTPQPAVRMVDAFESLSEGGASGEGGNGDGKTEKPTEGESTPKNPTDGDNKPETPNEGDGKIGETTPEAPTDGEDNTGETNTEKPDNPTGGSGNSNTDDNKPNKGQAGEGGGSSDGNTGGSTMPVPDRPNDEPHVMPKDYEPAVDDKKPGLDKND